MLETTGLDREYKYNNLHVYESVYKKHKAQIEEQLKQDSAFNEAWCKMRKRLTYVRVSALIDIIDE